MADENTAAPEAEATADAPADEWTPPTKEEWEAVQAEKNTTADKLKKVNAESADRRKKLAELSERYEDADGKSAREAAEAAKYKPFAIKAAAKAAFIEQGANSARVDRLFRMLDLERIDFDGDDIAGLEEQVAELKDEVPELFSAQSTKDGEDSVKPPKLNVAGKRPQQKELTPGEIVARQVFGR
ncbi:phage scaffolding protein [Amycolatopsis sp. NBC_01480]|uniref:phage scaffolding protein n=1 Tax=Amycolatopsis sp. NBC_01480 TaxID=2903562 RepID=UPI002E2D57C1|nr:phage scaffolding protein [Amycolatopsis sp. NBC_01480]